MKKCKWCKIEYIPKPENHYHFIIYCWCEEFCSAVCSKAYSFDDMINKLNKGKFK